MTQTTNHVLEIDARWENLPALTDYTTAVEHDFALTNEQAFVLGLVVEEIVTNIIKYSYNEQGGPLQLDCSMQDAELVIRIRDRGTPFDPHHVALPDLSADVQHRQIGGLGVFLVREMADSLTYQHDPVTGWNDLVISKKATTDANITPLVEFLAQLQMFNSVSEPTLRNIVLSTGHIRLAPNEFLFNEGDSGDDCFIVVAGDVDVLKYVGNETILLERCRPGAIIGEMALIDSSPRAASVRARTSATLLRITEAEFLTLMHANPTTAMSLLRGGTTRLRSSTAMMIDSLKLKNIKLEQAYEDLKLAQKELLRLERIEQELAIARDIQRFFLPVKIPQPQGWQICAFNRGALEVGGDFYDVLKLGHGRIGLLVADACGKGVPAALFVALARSLLRSSSQALASRPEITPDSMTLLSTSVSMVNNYIAREHGASNMFITLFYGILDPADGSFVYVNAGHNPPMVIDPETSEIRYLEGRALPLGIMDNLEYTTDRTVLAANELLLAFTDGVTEAFNSAGEVFDDQALVGIVQQHRYSNAETLLNEVKSAIDAFVGNAPQADDITLLTVSRG